MLSNSKYFIFLFLPTVTFAEINNVDKSQLSKYQYANKRENIENEKLNTSIDSFNLDNKPLSLEQLLYKALLLRKKELIQTILDRYRNESNADNSLILFTQGALFYIDKNYNDAINKFQSALEINPNLNPVRIELAKAFFLTQQNNNALEQFYKVRSEQDIPEPIKQLIDSYISAIEKRNEWHFNVNGYYIDDKNINNVSSDIKIENTGFKKNESMLPKSAQGFGYNFSLVKDINLINSHYLRFDNENIGKIFWSDHRFDDIYNRSSLGYVYKQFNYNFSLLPFYERRWYGNHRYQLAKGIRSEYQKWLSDTWQSSTTLEYSQNRYFESAYLNGNNKLISTRLAWFSNPSQVFFIGINFNRDKTLVKQYSSDTKGVYLGFSKEWFKLFSSRMDISMSVKKFKDKAILGDILPLGKIRKDKNYDIRLSLWKNEMQLWGIIPKLQFSWKKQDSNLDTMYSYTEKDIKLIFDKSF